MRAGSNSRIRCRASRCPSRAPCRSRLRCSIGGPPEMRRPPRFPRSRTPMKTGVPPSKIGGHTRNLHAPSRHQRHRPLSRRRRSISNDELVEAFNAYVELHNASTPRRSRPASATALTPSSVEFIEKASGIKSRYVDGEGPACSTRPACARAFQERADDELSLHGRDGVDAAARRSPRAGKHRRPTSTR